MQLNKEILKKYMPSNILKVVQYLHGKFYYHLTKQGRAKLYRCSYKLKGDKNGKNQKLYVLRIGTPGCGIFAAFRIMLTNIEYAIANDYILMIDYEFEADFLDKALGNDNKWEYCFQQPFGNSIKNLGEYKYIYVSELCELHGEMPRLVTKGFREYYSKYREISEKYCRLNDDIAERFEKTFSQLFFPEKKVCGVCVRDGFTLFRKMEFKFMENHPLEPSIDEIIKKAKEYMNLWKCDYLYLTAEYQDTIEIFEQEFNNKLIYTRRNRERITKEYLEWLKLNISHNGNTMEKKDLIKQRNSFLKAKQYNALSQETIVDYVEEIYGVSKCDYLLATQSGGTIGACILNGGRYQDIYIINGEGY